MSASTPKRSGLHYESYVARADPSIALAIAATTSPFAIEVRFLGGLTSRQMDAFKAAADRWTRVIVGDLPSVMVDNEVIDDVLILASGDDIDGPGQILGQAGPTFLRPLGAGSAAFLPAKGTMIFDTADLEKLESDGTLNDVITHEMGHVIGIGTLWDRKRLLQGTNGNNPIFIGQNARVEYGELRGGGGPTSVPVENTGGPGTRDSHWRESIFRNELMSGFIGATGNPLSRVTVASLKDLGYEVDFAAAEPYVLPDLFVLAEGGSLVVHEAPVDGGRVLPYLPIVLPEQSLV